MLTSTRTATTPPFVPDLVASAGKLVGAAVVDCAAIGGATDGWLGGSGGALFDASVLLMVVAAPTFAAVVDDSKMEGGEGG